MLNSISTLFSFVFVFLQYHGRFIKNDVYRKEPQKYKTPYVPFTYEHF